MEKEIEKNGMKAITDQYSRKLLAVKYFLPSEVYHVFDTCFRNVTFTSTKIDVNEIFIGKM